jgi:hypothetical protein
MATMWQLIYNKIADVFCGELTQKDKNPYLKWRTVLYTKALNSSPQKPMPQAVQILQVTILRFLL